MRYANKCTEEIQPNIDAYVEQHIAVTGKKPDMKAISEKLMEMAEERDRKAFFQIFEGYTAISLRLAARLAAEAAQEDNAKDCPSATEKLGSDSVDKGQGKKRATKTKAK